MIRPARTDPHRLRGGDTAAQSLDVCVIGGGPAGTAAAITAQSAGAQVCLIDRPSRGSPFLELISGRAGPTLAALGILELVSTIAQPCVGSVSRWTGAGFDEHSCLLDPGGGWIVDRHTLDHALRAEARRAGVSLLAQRLVALDDTARRYRLRLPDREVFADNVVVAVGGRRSPLRRTLQRRVRHRLVALGVRLAPAAIGNLGHRLLIDRGSRGWWYAVAGPAATDVVYCTDAAALRQGANGIRAVWREACASAADWLPAGTASQPPRVRAATVGAASPHGRDRVRLVGDCALSVDPLSGLGLTLAFESASRSQDPDYPDWIAETVTRNDRMEREVYRSARGVVGDFWDRRRA